MASQFESIIGYDDNTYSCVIVYFMTDLDGGSKKGCVLLQSRRPWMLTPSCWAYQVCAKLFYRDNLSWDICSFNRFSGTTSLFTPLPVKLLNQLLASSGGSTTIGVGALPLLVVPEVLSGPVGSLPSIEWFVFLFVVVHLALQCHSGPLPLAVWGSSERSTSPHGDDSVIRPMRTVTVACFLITFGFFTCISQTLTSASAPVYQLCLTVPVSVSVFVKLSLASVTHPLHLQM
jgi:hypothetical protein